MKVAREPALQDWGDMQGAAPFGSQVAVLACEVDARPESVTDEDLDRWFSGMLAAEIDFHNVVV